MSQIDINSFLLLCSIFLPFICGFISFFLTSNQKSFYYYFVTILGAVSPFLISWVLYFNFDNTLLNSYNFELKFGTGLEFLGVYLHLGLNAISLPLFILSATVGVASVIYAMNSVAEKLHIYTGLLLVMLSGLMGLFASIDLFFFYFFHEFALIPTFIMIVIWGGYSRYAIALEMTIYLTLGALLSLIGIIALYQASGASEFNMVSLKEAVALNPIADQELIFALLFFGLGILVSLFPFHSWAPKGYTVAPTGASMLHAGVLKKFGIYGLLQIAIPFLELGALKWSSWMVILGLGNVIIIGLITLSKNNLKEMISFGSVMHMGYAFVGLAAFSILGTGGVLLLLVAHGLSVALLFLISTCIYKRFNTFNMSEMGGLGTIAPNMSVVFVLAIMASIGLPGFANFWGEFLIFTAVANNISINWAFYFLVLGIVISAVYGLRAIGNIVFGEAPEKLKYVKNDFNFSEKLSTFILLASLILIGIFPKIFTDNASDYLEKNYKIESSKLSQYR